MDDETYLVCMPNGPSEFTDNLVGRCGGCGCEIMYRWHAPLGIPKVCVDCAAARASADDVTAITVESAAEVRAYLRGKRLN